MVSNVTRTLLARNAKHVANFPKGRALPLGLNLKTAVVTCMDSRMDIFDILGVEVGDIHIIRTAGGRIKDAIRSLIISQTQIGLEEVMLIQHTDCAALGFSDHTIRSKLLDKSLHGHLPATAPFQISASSFLPFPPVPKGYENKDRIVKDEARVFESVKEDVEWLRNNPLFDRRTAVSGWVYDVSNGRLREVSVPVDGKALKRVDLPEPDID